VSNFPTEHVFSEDGFDLGPEPPVADDLERAALDRYIDGLPETQEMYDYGPYDNYVHDDGII
jgi:hypothetical protein